MTWTRAKVLPEALRRLKLRKVAFLEAELTGDPALIRRERRRLEAQRTEIALCDPNHPAPSEVESAVVLSPGGGLP